MIGYCLSSLDTTRPQSKIALANANATPKFKTSNNLIKLASANSLDTYLIPEFTPISNQGALGSCVAQATADCAEILKGIENPNKVEQLSRLFVYYNARLYTQDTDKDMGTYITNAMKSLVDFGICRESMWYYNQSKVFTQPNQLAYKEGDDNKITSFYQIEDNNRLQNIETAIRANHPVVFGTIVDASFQNNYGVNKTFDTPTSSIGRHAMIVVGVRRNPNLEFYIRNSWGKSWGDNGHCWMTADYLDWNETNDIYVGTMMPDLLV